MDDQILDTIVAAILSALACGLLALLVPTLIAAIPEPEADGEPKLQYRDIAAGRGLAWRSALVAAVVGGAFGATLDGSWELLVVLPLVPIGVALAVVDWRTQLLPKFVVAPTYGIVILTCSASAILTGEPDRLVDAAIGWAVLGGLYLTLWFIYPPGMGYGDVRLAGVLGIALGYLGYQPTVYGLLLGLLLGGFGGALLSALRVVDRRNCPFGPFLLAGAAAGVVVAGLVAG